MSTPRFPLAGRALFLVFALVVLAACSGSPSAEEAEAGADADHPMRIAQGAEVNLADYSVAGEYVVFDFMSDYCPPCRQVAPWMNRLHAEREGVSVVKIDINRPGVRGIDWQSPVVAQFGINSVPHFKVMDGSGQIVAEGDAAWQMLVGWLKELPQVPPTTQG